MNREIEGVSIRFPFRREDEAPAPRPSRESLPLVERKGRPRGGGNPNVAGEMHSLLLDLPQSISSEKKGVARNGHSIISRKFDELPANRNPNHQKPHRNRRFTKAKAK